MRKLAQIGANLMDIKREIHAIMNMRLVGALDSFCCVVGCGSCSVASPTLQRFNIQEEQ